MTVFTERKAIKERMEQILKERRELQSEYYELMSRLRELDNHERQAYDVEGILHTLTETVNNLTTLLPSIPANVLIESLQNKFAPMIQAKNETEEIVKKDNVIIDHISVAEQQEKDSNIKTRKTNDLKKVTKLIALYLKEKPTPSKSKEIEIKLKNEHGLEWDNFNNVLRYAMNYDKNISKAGFGYYQYKAF